MVTTTESEVLILGAGVTGLAAGVELKKSAIILERENRAGGLVRSHCFDGGYWFDNVLHLLHFKDDGIQSLIKSMLGSILKPCHPVAWIECKEGTVMYPFQLNLGGLNDDARNRCITDYAKAYFTENGPTNKLNYKEYLQATFGNSMCEFFYFPYNEKLYKYPLSEITADDILWNLHRPSFEEILNGAFLPNVARITYNTNAFYPCPAKDATLRGMEILSQALAKKTHHIELNTIITSLNLPSKSIFAYKDGIKKKFVYKNSCLSTIPLPYLMKICTDVPDSLMQEVNRLKYTNVFSVALSIKGPRPENTGQWRYYTNPDLPFTRLIFMTEFDTNNAPQDGWGLLAEITWPCNQPDPIEEVLIQKVINALYSVSLMN